MSEIVIGMGEVGKAVQALVSATHSYDYTGALVDFSIYPDIEVMHICFPHSDAFVEELRRYAGELKPVHIVVWSTVPVGTCGSIDARIVHSPVEGKHPDLELSIRQAERWVGCNTLAESQYFYDYFTKLGLRPKILADTRYTEALKLLSTTEYGVNLIFADYKAKVAEAIGMPFELTKEWNRMYNQLYKDLGLEKKFQKFVLDPPKGEIGGHCVRDNAKLLNQQYPDTWVIEIGEYE